jgi:hypothetical protein
MNDSTQSAASFQQVQLNGSVLLLALLQDPVRRRQSGNAAADDHDARD